MRNLFVIAVLLLPFLALSQQNKLQKSNLKFGDIKAKDFEPTAYEVDSSASAVVLADIGQSKFEGNNDGFFSIVFKHHKRIRIMNKNGFDNASISITVYSQGNTEEKIDDLEAYTYNIDGEKVVATRLEKSSVFKDRVNKYYTVRKFTFPNLREGSILEYKYTITTPFYRYLRNWEFQGSMPRIWSEYSVSVPSLFDYVLINQGYRQYDITDANTSNELFNIIVPGESAYEKTEVVKWEGNVYNNVWAVKDVPALKDEAYTTSLSNHLQKIEFQLRSIRWPSGKVDDFMGTWMKLADDLLKHENFGATLTKNNSFFDDEINKAITGAADEKEKVAGIYRYVRDNFTCTDHDAIFMSNPLKKTFQNKNGNVADINLLLIAMLKSKGLEAQPVLLSTTDNGKAYELYPLLTRFNYVIARVKVGEQFFLLDASRDKMGFGKLPTDLYNGYARIIEQPIPNLIDLSPDSLMEAKVTSVFIMNAEDGKGMSGAYTSNLGYYESVSLRDKLAKTTTEEYFKEIKKSYSFEVDLSNTSVDMLKSYDDPAVIKYDFNFSAADDIVYFNPLLTEAMKDNPFTSANRQYPVEMPYTINKTYVLSMDIPKGYVVEELPKSSRVKLNDDEGMFEYLISSNGTTIQFRSRLLISKATFEKEDYEVLRNFFSMIVKKHSELVVLKKKD
jgi:transglutaminase-like putative cysteine protease